MPFQTDAKIRNAKPKAAPYKLVDEKGLFLLINPASERNRQGTKLWRYRYHFGGEERLMALGAYPEIGLTEARSRRDSYREMIAAGRDPRAEKQAAKLLATIAPSRSFKAVATAWHTRKAKIWTPATAKQTIERLEAYIFPELGALDIDAISKPMVVACLHKIEARPAVIVARRVRQYIDAVYEFAQAAGLTERNPAANVTKALEEEPVSGKMPAIIDLGEFVAMMRRAEAEFSHPVSKAGLRFIALTAARPRMVRYATWGEIEDDGNMPVWHLVPERMKTREEYFSPLSGPAMDVLRALRPLTYNGAKSFIFPNVRRFDVPMSANTILYLLARAGYESRHVTHGFRSSFSSIMSERFPADRDAIEAQLAHTLQGTRGHYMRSPFLERRAELLSEWAGLIMAGAKDAETLLLGPRRR